MSISYRPEIDGLRAIAVLAVVLYHAEFAGLEFLKGGYLGVDIFFVLSGYLISGIILKEKAAGSFSFRNFYMRRIRRILPALLTVLTVSSIFAYIYLIPDRMLAFTESMQATLFFYANHHFWGQVSYFDIAAIEKPLLHMWSLAVEEQFYIFFPIILLMAWRFCRKWIWGLIAVAFLLSLAAADYAASHYPNAAFYLLPFRGWELLAGAFLANLHFGHTLDKNEHASRLVKWFTHSKWLHNIMPAIGLAMILGSIATFDNETLHPSRWTLIPILGTMLIIYFARKGEWVTTLLSLYPIRWLGLISYSLYLWHIPVFSFAHIFDATPDNYMKAGYVSLCVALAAFNLYLIERPYRKPNLVTNKRILSICLGFYVSLYAFHGLALQSQGFMERFDKTELAIISSKPAELNAYMVKRFDELEFKAFDLESEKKKILVVGDSFGKDFVNIILENNLANNVQISTYYIAPQCGNLMLPYNFDEQIEKRLFYTCEGLKRFKDNNEVMTLLKQADTVFLVTSWNEWQSKLVAESLAYMQKFTDANIIVVGRKYFGDFTASGLLRIKKNGYEDARGKPPEYHMRIQKLMREQIPSEHYLDMHTLLCGKDAEECPLFDKDGFWITYDGVHLTRYGVKYVGDILKEDAILREELALSK
jgi:peptidoglycan/LPS O-acetylase OafA/YrhL